MGLGSIYWRFRSLVNAVGGASVGLVATEGTRFGFPPAFAMNVENFRRGSEMLLTVGASLLGFIIAAVTLIYAITASKRFDLLRSSRSFSELASAARSAMFWLLVASLLGAVAAFIEPSLFERIGPFAVFLSVFIASQAAASTSALTWVIGRLVTIT